MATRKKIKKIHEKLQEVTRFKSYKYLLTLIIMDMFNWTLPDEVRREFVEWCLLNLGYVAIWEDNGLYYVGEATTSDYDAYKIPRDGAHMDCYTRGGEHFAKVLGKDCIIIYNNDIRKPDIWTHFYADMFAETDLSQYTLIKKSRLSPIPVVTSDNLKKTIDELLDKIDEGSTTAIADSDMLLRVESGDTTKSVDMISLTTPEQIERMQYLSKYHDDLLRRVCTLYGIPLQSSGKMAQVNEKELEGYDTFSLILPDQMMRARKDGIEEGKRVFGESFPFDIDFGEPWKVQNERTKEEPTDEVEPSGDSEPNEDEEVEDDES